MTKEDLNRRFGDPERQKHITPPDLLAAAHLIRDYCNGLTGGCKNCIFLKYVHQGIATLFTCLLFEQSPSDWQLSDAEHKTADWIDKQYFQGRGLYIDTDIVK